MRSPKISVITVVFNGEKLIGRTIDSVVNQTYNQIEYIIIDGKSTDGTLEVISGYMGVDKLINLPEGYGGIYGIRAGGYTRYYLRRYDDYQ
jgi:glycosyltransferase involved in cell wall biosynthesis